MKKTKRHIVSAWILLVCFFAGQGMVLAHQHKANSNIITKSWHADHNKSQSSFKEKCEVCDSMHHNVMMLTEATWFSHVVSVPYHYTDVSYKFVSISLVLSAGRSPPLS